MSYFRLERRFQRPAAPLLALLALGLLLLLLTLAPPAGAQTGTNDYDTDDDGLIDIDSLAKLNAIRYDVNGDGLRGTVSSTDWTNNYLTAFPDPLSTQCPSGCQGYELTASLTFPSSGAYSSWSPLGADAAATRYNTTFNGRGHTLTDLSVTSNTEHVGLFGRLAAGAVIRDLGLINPTISQAAGANPAQNARLGALAGSANAGATVTAVYVSGGSITSYSANNDIGGLMGNTAATITASWSNAAIGQSDPCSNCNSVDAGGLVGYLSGAGSITASYASAAVSLSGTALRLGGLVGYVNGASARITNSYCNSTVMVVSGCVGARSADANAALTAATAQTTAQLQAPVNYSGNYRGWNVDLDGDNTPDNPWQFGTASDLPTLSTAAQRQTVVGDFDGDDDGLIDINTTAQLIAISEDLNGNGDATTNTYADAFPGRWTHSSNRMGCSSGTCTGYELTADITLTAAWTPTGTYTATFDGGGHQISGLSVSHGGDSGMFGGLGGSAIVRDLRLISPAIAQTGTNARSSGALVGYIDTGTTVRISAVSVEGGSVTTTSNNSNVGGLVGFIRSGGIRASWASATAGRSGSPTGVDAGGLVGELADADITASYSTGATTGDSAGWLIGRATNANADVVSTYCVGAAGVCVGTDSAGIGTPPRYTAAQMQTPIGYTGIFANWNIDLDGGGSNDEPWKFGTSSDLPTLWAPADRATVDYDVNDDGLIDISTAAQLDALRHDLDGNGDATHGNYIAAFHHRATGAGNWMGCPTGTCTGYELLNDLDLSGYTNWTPIAATAGYAATFDGNGHTIANLTIGTVVAGYSGGSAAGLFSTMASTGSILRVGVTGAAVYGGGASNQAVGILVGENQGTIRFSYTTGRVDAAANGANHKTGGLVGHLNEGGSILASYSTATVSGPTIAAAGQSSGGLVGQVGGVGGSETGTITAAYASGGVSATTSATDGNVGGLVGFNRRGNINQSYAYGRVGGTLTTTNSGGLVGQSHADGTEIDSYYDTTTSTQSDTGKGESKTTAELQEPLAYAGTIYANWDVDVDGVSGDDDPWDFGTTSQYPALKVDFNEDNTDSAYEFGVQGRTMSGGGGNGGGGRPSVAPPARGGGQPYNPAADHPEIYQNARYEMAAACAVRTTGTGDNAITTSTLTFDLGAYTRPITLALSLWDGTHYRTLQSQGIAMPAFQRDGQTATVEVVTDPAQTRFRLDGQYGLNLILGYADCRTDDP